MGIMIYVIFLILGITQDLYHQPLEGRGNKSTYKSPQGDPTWGCGT